MLAALAAVAATGAAFAQSTVTLYGAVDAGYTQYKSGTTKVTGMGNSQLGSSLIGFRGEEDLGGGLKAIFKLEGGLANDSGAGKASNSNNQASGSGVTAGAATGQSGAQGLDFGRYAHVGVAGSFGEVRLGRDYTAAFQWGVAAADVFGTNGPADASAMMLNLGAVNKQATTSGASNMVGYITPKINGFEAKLQAFFGENKSDSTTVGSQAKAGDGTSIAIKYSEGPLMVGYGTQTTKGTVSAAVAATSVATNGQYEQSGLSASYDLGVAKVIYTNAKESLVKVVGEEITNKTNLFGVVVPMGAINLKASYALSTQNSGAAGAADTKGTLMGLGADYALSKRTTAYATYAKVTNKDGGASYSAATSALSSAANNSSTGFAVGVKHNF
jgi:predicted porin